MNGWTPLQFSVETGSTEIVGHLLSAGADVNVRFKSTLETPLSVAATNSCFPLVKMLLSKAADPDCKAGAGFAPLHIAAIAGDTNILDLLLESGANPLVGDDNSWTALHHAAYRGHSVVASRLMEASSHLSLFERDG